MANTTISKHLTTYERIKIEGYVKAKLSVSEIAKALNRHYSTIYRELKRGQCKLMNYSYEYYTSYSAEIGRNTHKSNMQKCGVQDLKIGKNFEYMSFIENLIKNKKYSPASAIAMASKQGFKFQLSKTTIYRYIDNNYFLSITNKDLPVGKYSKHSYNKVKSLPTKNIFCQRITERPKAIDLRQDVGHWEMDTVVGQRNGKSTSLLVLTERKTRHEIIMKISSRTAKEVVKSLDKLQRKYKSKFKTIFKTITCDNGSEFMDTNGIEKGNRTKLFYCHAYSSWERGSNENANKLIRRFIPKGTDISKYTNKQIQQIENWINNYPRKLFEWKCSNDLYKELNPQIS